MTVTFHLGSFLTATCISVTVLSLYTMVLMCPPRLCSWPVTALMWALKLSANVLLLYGRPVAIWVSISGDAIYWVAILFGGDDGRGKRLWGKLRSAALTAINQASFHRQASEVRS